MTKSEFTKAVRCHSKFVIQTFIRHSPFGIRNFSP